MARKKKPGKAAKKVAAKTQTVSINDAIKHAIALARKDKGAEAATFLEQVAQQLSEASEGKNVSTAQLLLKSAQTTANAHPATGLVLAKEAIKLEPEMAAGWAIKASLQDKLGEHKEAKEATLKVLEISDAPPDNVIAASNLLVRYGVDEQAFEAATEAYEKLDRPLRHANTVLYIAQRVAHWPSVTQLTDQIKQAYAEDKYSETRESPRTNLLWCDDEKVNIKVTELWSKGTMPKVTDAALPLADPLEGRRIRVGYLSSDYRDHPTSRLINGLFRNHDRNRFELFLYCSGWDDGSAMRKEIESHMDHVHSVAKMGDVAAAKLIRSHGIDVLVELNGPTRANRMGILAHRPAPVQIDYLGWPGSVGGRVVDYVVGDTYTVPAGAEQSYPEKVIRVAATYQINDYRGMQRAPAPSRKSAGLPEDESIIVLGMFNAINKVHAEVWAVWVRILKAVPNSVLWLLDPGIAGRKNIAEACRDAGISVRRIIGAPRMSQNGHLARMQCCDLMLDPWPYGGHTSTSDALFAGVPVVTLEGKNFAGRVSGGLLRAAGLKALVLPDKDAYVRMAIRLARDPAELKRIKQHILDHVMETAIFDAPARTRQFEAAYERALKFVEQGKPPQHITVRGRQVRAESVPQVVPSAPLKREEVVEMPQILGNRPKLILVCGPWSSGTSAMAGFLAKAGLYAPGPYFRTNDPRTQDTYEMLAFRNMLNTLASENDLKRRAGPTEALAALRRFAVGPLAEACERDGFQTGEPIVLKHALPVLILPEIAEIFDLKVIGVLRPLEDIETTRIRRKWHASFGKLGAGVIYSQLLNYLINGSTPFKLVRYTDLLAQPAETLEELAEFCGINVTEDSRAAALAFVDRPTNDQQHSK